MEANPESLSSTIAALERIKQEYPDIEFRGTLKEIKEKPQEPSKPLSGWHRLTQLDPKYLQEVSFRVEIPAQEIQEMVPRWYVLFDNGELVGAVQIIWAENRITGTYPFKPNMSGTILVESFEAKVLTRRES